MREALFARVRLLKGLIGLFEGLLVEPAKLKPIPLCDSIEALLKALIVVGRTHDAAQAARAKGWFDHRLVCTLLLQSSKREIRPLSAFPAYLDQLIATLQAIQGYVVLLYEPEAGLTLRAAVNRLLELSAKADNFLARAVAFGGLTFNQRPERQPIFYDRLFDNELLMSLPRTGVPRKLEEDSQFAKLRTEARSVLFDALIKLPFNPERRHRFLGHCFEELNYLIHAAVS